METKLKIDRLDHLVLTVKDIQVSCEFYSRVLGMEEVTFGAGRKALQFGCQKINLHPAQAPIVPHAAQPMTGSADLCFIASGSMSSILQHLERVGVQAELGPVSRTGALGPITSVYIRDPDGNLIEVSVYEET